MGPERSARSEPYRCQQVAIDVPNAKPKEPVLVNESEHLLIRGNRREREIPRAMEHLVSTIQVANGDLTDDKRMDQDSRLAEQSIENRIV